ncbi:MAG TPA: hypothetical protein VGM05_14260 [Planctomycetaceae bacterium]|jgi:hypothetical protein
MWNLNPLSDVPKRLDRFKKKWAHEMTNVFDNLDTVVEALNAGTKAEQLKQLGFVHSEPFGVLAIDQRGPGKGSKLKQFRLYVFPEEDAEQLHLITLGDKDSQQDDIKQAKSFAQGLLQKKITDARRRIKDDSAQPNAAK